MITCGRCKWPLDLCPCPEGPMVPANISKLTTVVVTLAVKPPTMVKRIRMSLDDITSGIAKN